MLTFSCHFCLETREDSGDDKDDDSDDEEEENYEVDFYLKAVRQSQCRFVKEQLVRNRRYRAMQQMIRYRLLIFTGNFSGIMPNFLKIC